MRSHPVGLDVWCLVGPYVCFHTLCVQTAKALAQMHRLAWAFADRLCDKYHNLMSWLICLLFQTPNSCFNGVEYFYDDDNTSLLCTESIDTLDLEDIPK